MIKQYTIHFNKLPSNILESDNRETKIQKVQEHYIKLHKTLVEATNLFDMDEVHFMPVIGFFAVEGNTAQAKQLQEYLLKQGDNLTEFKDEPLMLID